jgi:hypothetical protein
MTETNDRPHPTPPRAGTLASIARRIAAVVSEYNYAQRRIVDLQMAPDLYAADRDRAPDTYGEFLFRARGRLRHEPPARDRGTR